MYNKNKKTMTKMMKGAAVAVIALLLSLLAIVSVSAADAANGITSITLNKSKTDINVEIRLTKEYVKEKKSSTIYLFELLPHQSASEINSLEPIKTFKIGQKLSAKIPYYNGNITRLYSKFVIAEKLVNGSYSIIGGAKYIENIEALAQNTEGFPVRSSIKGLSISKLTDAQALGVQHTVIEIPMNEYMLTSNSDKAVSFHYNGQTYYIDSQKLALLDHRVKVYTEAGINVYFNIVLTAPKGDNNPNFYFENSSSTAKLYALNTNNEVGMNAFQAFMDYMCGRYTSPGHEHGFVPGIILGFEVNSGSVWNNAGDTDASAYAYSYCTAFRIAYTAMRSHYSEGMVYISLGNNFNAVSSSTDPADTAQDSSAKSFLDTFNTAIKDSGDIEWGLSVNPYPSTPDIMDYWTDNLAEHSSSTPFITMKNISILTSYMNTAGMLYNSEPRSIMIGEFGISGDPSSEASMNKQAAAYGLAYYTAAQDPDIDAFIYSTHIDGIGDNTYCGIWSMSAGETVKKPIYDVFAQIDTEKSQELSSFIRATVGSSTFDTYVEEGTKYKIFHKRTVLTAEKADPEEHQKGYKQQLLCDLTKGSLLGFYPSNDMEYVELRTNEEGGSAMYAKVLGTLDSYKGISKTFDIDKAMKDAHYVSVRVKADAPESATSVTVLLRFMYNGDDKTNFAVYEGEATIKANEWETVSFNVRDFAKAANGELDVVGILMKNNDGTVAEGEYGIWLENITIYTKGGTSGIAVFFVVLLVLVLIAVAGYGVLYLRAQLIRRKRRAEMLRRKQDALRRQAMMQTRSTPLPPQYRRPPNNEER